MLVIVQLLIIVINTSFFCFYTHNVSTWTVYVSLPKHRQENKTTLAQVCFLVFEYLMSVWALLPSAPHSQQHQMDPLEIAREKIKNNSCQISKRNEQGKKKTVWEEEGGGGESYLTQVKPDWQSMKGLLGNFTEVLKWLSWSCQLQTACQNATQAFLPSPGGWCTSVRKTEHVCMRLTREQVRWWLVQYRQRAKIHTWTHTKHYLFNK